MSAERMMTRCASSSPGPFLEASPTSAGGQSTAPLSIAAALGPGCALQLVSSRAGEVHHVVQVELGAVGEAAGGVSRVAAGDG